MSDDEHLFPRTPVERLLAIEQFLRIEMGHRTHLLATTRVKVENAETEDERYKLRGKLTYWKTSVHNCQEVIDDVVVLIEQTK